CSVLFLCPLTYTKRALGSRGPGARIRAFPTDVSTPYLIVRTQLGPRVQPACTPRRPSSRTPPGAAARRPPAGRPAPPRCPRRGPARCGQLGLPPQESGGVHGGAPDRLGGGHPAPDQEDELLGGLAVGEDAGAGAEGDVDAG